MHLSLWEHRKHRLFGYPTVLCRWACSARGRAHKGNTFVCVYTGTKCTVHWQRMQCHLHLHQGEPLTQSIFFASNGIVFSSNGYLVKPVRRAAVGAPKVPRCPSIHPRRVALPEETVFLPAQETRGPDDHVEEHLPLLGAIDGACGFVHQAIIAHQKGAV